MGDAAITLLLENMADLVKYHVDLISGAKGELENLKDDLIRMRTLLEDASKKRYKEEHFKAWERKLRSVVYEVEDTIDTCITQEAIEKKKNVLRRTFTTKNINLAGKVKSLREENVKSVLDMVKTLGPNFNMVEESDRIIDNNMIYRNKPPREENVVGFEDETETLIGYLMEESEGLEVVTIIGMPGLGKTTVAWKIHQHPKIKFEFRICIWIVVSQEFIKRDVFLTILKKFTDQDMSGKTDTELVNLVKGYLVRSKFLLFLDDVWTSSAWNEILNFLPKNNSMGRVLITTRNQIVNQHANHIRAPHKLRFLSADESWKLLRLEVFDDLDNCPKELENYGVTIAKKCDGLPLAIIVIGGILFKRSIAGEDTIKKSEWELISKNTDIIINRDDSNNSMEKMISLSYTNLPYELRDCFLYVGGMFPEDSEISAWELIKLWIAEGFIKQKPNGKSLEATAHDNLKELINTNLVMVDKIKPNGDVKTCRIHDSIREFCKNEAGYDKQNLFHEVKKGDDGIFLYNEQNCRRLSIHSYVKDFFLKKVKATKLHHTRSFLSFTNPINLEPHEIPTFTDVFELLRIFNAKTMKFPKFPSNFTKLIHLRYLTISVPELYMLPKAISKLWNLQTLTVDTQSSTLKFEANIWLMMQLRHVITKASIVLTCKDAQGDGGEKLQTLDKLSPESCTKEVFEKASNLSTLGIRGELAKLEEDSTCLEQLHRLEKLKLVNHVNGKVAAENPLKSLPCKFPGKLKFLTLANTYLDWEHMSTVGNIPNLEVLKLKENAFRGDCWDSVSGGFLNLEYLYITRSSLKLWRIIAGDDPFPSLKTLVLKTCQELQLVPKDLVMKLNKLEMHRVSVFAVKSAKEVYADRKKIEEIQKIKRGGFKLIIGPGDDQN